MDFNVVCVKAKMQLRDVLDAEANGIVIEIARLSIGRIINRFVKPFMKK